MYEYDKVVLEVDADGTEKARNLYGTNLLMRTIDDESYYYLYNGHADVTALINTDRSIATTYYYDAFGNILEQTGDVDNNITYSGYQYDEETGLYYLNARMYDPKIARFLQEDTYRGNINDPLSLNLYTYCNNNPMVYIDPSGHKPFRDAWNWIKDKWWKITGKDNNNDDSEPVLKEYEPSNTELFINKLDEAAGRTKVFLHGFGSGLGGDALGELACEIFYGSQMTDEEKQQYHLRTLQDSMDKTIILVPKVGHTIRGPNGIVSRSTNGITNARDLIARGIMELRRVYPDIQNTQLQKLIDMNKELYPAIRKGR